MNEKKIKFPDGESIVSPNKRILSNFNVSNEKEITKTTTKIISYINYLIENSLLSNLPSELHIVYVEDNSFFINSS